MKYLLFASVAAFFFSACRLAGKAAQRPTRKEFLVGTAPMSRKDDKTRRFSMQLAETADDFVCESRIIVAIAQDERLADTLFEPALVVNCVANVEQA